MICEMCKPLLLEYLDGRLEPARRAPVETHLAQCPDCAALVHDFRAIGDLLHALPLSQTSPRFEARLAERLAQTRPAKTPWLQRLSEGLPPPSLWRPALAFSAAALAIAGAIAFQHPTSPGPSPTPTVSEGSLVTHCVQQHRSYVAAQPLSDLAAQNLANQLDETASAPPAAITEENDL